MLFLSFFFYFIFHLFHILFYYIFTTEQFTFKIVFDKNILRQTFDANINQNILWNLELYRISRKINRYCRLKTEQIHCCDLMSPFETRKNTDKYFRNYLFYIRAWFYLSMCEKTWTD